MRHTRPAPLLLLAALAAAGCGGGSAAPARPAVGGPAHVGAVVTLGCDDPAVARALDRLASGWAGRSGATVRVVPVGEADVRVIRPAAVGAAVAGGAARPVPKELFAADHPAQFSRLLAVYRTPLPVWGGTPVAVPLAGDARVLVYRADKLADRTLAPPAAWEDLAAAAAAFGPGSLPPADPARLLAEFDLFAACYDRPALTEGDTGKKADESAAAGGRMLSFHHDVSTGRPRLTAPGFAAAAELLRRLQPLRMAGESDPVAAVANGTAVFAVLTLAEVGRLPRDGDVVSPRFGVAPPPGTRRCFDPATGAERPPPDRSTGVNFVPYAGAGGWVGVVGEKAAHPAAAFDLLADLASPARSFELLNDPALGFGPYRTEHLDPAREAVWGRYGFDAERTKRLADALRRFAAVAVVNPAFAPRGPDQAELTAVLAKHVRRAAAGEAAPADAMKQANDEWAAWDAAHPPAAEWRRKSAGLN